MSKDVENAIVKILEHIGEDPKRAGLLGTPERVIRMYKEIFRGYDPTQKPKVTIFDNGTDGIVYDPMIIDTGDFYSQCEHHIVPFFGKYWFAYIPNTKGKILGISKVARMVDYHAAKLQIQERLVNDVITDLWDALITETGVEPVGMALMMEGEHLCKTMRGAKKKGTMTTCSLKGVFKTNASTKSEFMQMVVR